MKALSIRQPWPWAILHLPPGIRKDIENRDWKPGNPAVCEAQRLIRTGEPFLIHAGKTFDQDDIDSIEGIVREITNDPYFVMRSPFIDETTYPTGGIVGQARLIGMVYQSESPWFFGPRGLVIADAKPLPFVPCKGALGFFDVPAEVEQAVTQAMAA